MHVLVSCKSITYRLNLTKTQLGCETVDNCEIFTKLGVTCGAETALSVHADEHTM